MLNSSPRGQTHDHAAASFDAFLESNRSYVFLWNVELSIECYKLTNKDVLSKSDPQVTVEMAFEDNVFREIGRTEIVRDNLSPKFSTSILTDYFFERKQTLRFSVHDVDADSRDFIGRTQCSVADIMGSRGEITKDLESEHHHNAGKIVRARAAQPRVHALFLWPPE